MSVLAAGELCREHLRQVERLVWDVVVAKNVAEGRAETLYASYAARIRHEREVWAEGLTGLADALDALLDVDGAVAYAQANWTPVEPESTGKALWRTVRKQEPPAGWRSPDAAEVSSRLAASNPHTEAWIMGALQVYLGMAMQTSTEAGTMSLRQLGKGTTWEWANPRVMARDLYAVRGSKVIQQMYGNHIDQLRNVILSATDPRSPKTLAQVRALVKESWPALRKYQIDRIARTETATLWTHTSMQAYAANGVEHWESTIAHGPSIGVESEDPCHECIAESVYLHDMAGDWPPWHPNCRCEAVPVFEDPVTGDVWLPPDEPWAGGGAAGQDLAIVEGTEAAAVRYPAGPGPILSPAPLPAERMAMRPTTQVASEPYRLPRRGTGRMQTYTPEGDVRAMITSCNNKISGLKTRIKREEEIMGRGGLFDHAKLNDLKARIQEQYRLRAELKGRLGELPPPQPPPVTPPTIPDKPWALDDTQAVFEDILSGYRGHRVEVKWESGGKLEGTLTREGEYWLVDGKTVGNGRGVVEIRVRTGDSWTRVAEKLAPPELKLPERALTLDATEERLHQVLRNLEEQDVKVWYRSGDQFQGKLVWDDGRQAFVLQGERDVRLITQAEHVLRVEVRVVEDNTVRYVTVASQKLKSVEELRAEITSTGNKLSGLKTRLKREQQRPEGPRYDEVLAIQERIRALEVERERLRLALEEAKGRPVLPPEQPPGPVEPPQPQQVVDPSGRRYLERGPGSSPLADDLAQIRGTLRNGTTDEEMRAVIRAGERVQAELDAQGLRHLDQAIRRAETDKAVVDVRGADIRERIEELEHKFRDAIHPYQHRAAMDTYGRPFPDLTYMEQRAVANASVGAPEVEVLREALRATRSELTAWYDEAAASRQVVADAVEAKLIAERESLMSVLSSVRDMGPTANVRLSYLARNTEVSRIPAGSTSAKYKARSFAKTKKVLEDAQRFLPRSWLRLQRPVDAGWVSRGWHSRTSGGQELRVSGGRGKIKSDRDGLPTGIHEMGHEVEDTVPLVIGLERRFYEYRTAGESTSKLGRGYRDNEVTRRDEFADPYMGKYYGYDSYEVVSMGLESIWTGYVRIDPEARSFILGLLALV